MRTRLLSLVAGVALMLGSCTSGTHGTTVYAHRVQLALITRMSAAPCTQSQFGNPVEYRDPGFSASQACLTLAAPIAQNADLVKVHVVYDSEQHSWLVTGNLTSAAAKRFDALARAKSRRGSATFAVVIDTTVLATFALSGTPGIAGLLLPGGGGAPRTRAEAIALLTRITEQQP
jgi:hypothetical protein